MVRFLEVECFSGGAFPERRGELSQEVKTEVRGECDIFFRRRRFS